MTDERLDGIKSWFCGIEHLMDPAVKSAIGELLDEVERLQKLVPVIYIRSAVHESGETWVVEEVDQHEIDHLMDDDGPLEAVDIDGLRKQGYRVKVLEAPTDPPRDDRPECGGLDKNQARVA